MPFLAYLFIYFYTFSNHITSPMQRKYPLNAVLHISKKYCTFARRHHFSNFETKKTQFSPPSAQANGGYTLI